MQIESRKNRKMCVRLLGSPRRLVRGTSTWHSTVLRQAGCTPVSATELHPARIQLQIFASFLSFISLQGKRQRQRLSAGVLSSQNILHPRPKVHHILKGLWICMFSHLHPNVFLWEHYSVLVADPKRTPIKTIFIPSNTIFNGFISRTTVWEHCAEGEKWMQAYFN